MGLGTGDPPASPRPEKSRWMPTARTFRLPLRALSPGLPSAPSFAEPELEHSCHATPAVSRLGFAKS